MPALRVPIRGPIGGPIDGPLGGPLEIGPPHRPHTRRSRPISRRATRPGCIEIQQGQHVGGGRNPHRNSTPGPLPASMDVRCRSCRATGDLARPPHCGPRRAAERIHFREMQISCHLLCRKWNDSRALIEIFRSFSVVVLNSRHSASYFRPVPTGQEQQNSDSRTLASNSAIRRQDDATNFRQELPT